VSESNQPHIGQLLRDAFARFEAELIEATPPVDGVRMRPTHNHVLRHLDLGGTRASEIATRAGLTRQAITQIVDELEAAGVVAREPDPEDGRAKRIVYTDVGRAAFAESRSRIAAIDERWRSELGAERWASLRTALSDLVEAGRRAQDATTDDDERPSTAGSARPDPRPS
jgi:DNA-binding MarR family transcriptional regulator